MARIIMTLLGLVLLAAGVWTGYLWWDALLIALKSLATMLLIILGLGLLIFGISEISGARRSGA